MDSIGGNGGMAGSRKHAACMVGGLAARGEWEESYYRGATLRTTRGSCQLRAEALHSLKYTISCFCRCQSPLEIHFKEEDLSIDMNVFMKYLNEALAIQTKQDISRF